MQPAENPNMQNENNTALSRRSFLLKSAGAIAGTIVSCSGSINAARFLGQLTGRDASKEELNLDELKTLSEGLNQHIASGEGFTREDVLKFVSLLEPSKFRGNFIEAQLLKKYPYIKSLLFRDCPSCQISGMKDIDSDTKLYALTYNASGQAVILDETISSQAFANIIQSNSPITQVTRFERDILILQDGDSKYEINDIAVDLFRLMPFEQYDYKNERFKQEYMLQLEFQAGLHKYQVSMNTVAFRRRDLPEGAEIPMANNLDLKIFNLTTGKEAPAIAGFGNLQDLILQHIVWSVIPGFVFPPVEAEQ